MILVMTELKIIDHRLPRNHHFLLPYIRIVGMCNLPSNINKGTRTNLTFSFIFTCQHIKHLKLLLLLLLLLFLLLLSLLLLLLLLLLLSSLLLLLNFLKQVFFFYVTDKTAKLKSIKTEHWHIESEFIFEY